MIPPGRLAPEDFIRRAAPGSCIYTTAHEIHGPNETVLLLRERSARIRSIRPVPIVEFRTGVWDLPTAHVIAITFKIKRAAGADLHYENWLNFHNPTRDTPQVLQLLAHQPRLLLRFYDDDGVGVRTIETSNPVCDFAGLVVEIFAGIAPWTMADFDLAKEHVIEHYPTPQSLCLKLGELTENA